MSGGKVFPREIGDRSVRITTATTTQVTGSATKGGVLKRLIIAATAAGTITVNDSVGTKLVLGASYPVGVYELNLLCTGKIEVVTGAASDITVTYDTL